MYPNLLWVCLQLCRCRYIGRTLKSILPCKRKSLKHDFFFQFFLGVPGIELTEILQFITGSSAAPVIGFDEKLQLTFVHGCVVNCKCFPTASTCDILLRIPVHFIAIEDVKTSFHGALKDGFVFALI